MLSVAKYFLAAQAILSFLFLKMLSFCKPCTFPPHGHGVPCSRIFSVCGKFRSVQIVYGVFSSLPNESRQNPIDEEQNNFGLLFFFFSCWLNIENKPPNPLRYPPPARSAFHPGYFWYFWMKYKFHPETLIGKCTCSVPLIALIHFVGWFCRVF